MQDGQFSLKWSQTEFGKHRTITAACHKASRGQARISLSSRNVEFYGSVSAALGNACHERNHDGKSKRNWQGQRYRYNIPQGPGKGPGDGTIELLKKHTQHMFAEVSKQVFATLRNHIQTMENAYRELKHELSRVRRPIRPEKTNSKRNAFKESGRRNDRGETNQAQATKGAPKGGGQKRRCGGDDDPSKDKVQGRLGGIVIRGRSADSKEDFHEKLIVAHAP